MFAELEKEKPGIFNRLFSKKKKTEEDENFKNNRIEILLENCQRIQKETESMTERQKMYKNRKETFDAGLKDVGAATTKFKILITYTQCMTFLPVVFDVPWPETMVKMMKILELTNFDLYTVFGEVGCHVS
jgi:hypothetical protein